AARDSALTGSPSAIGAQIIDLAERDPAPVQLGYQFRRDQIWLRKGKSHRVAPVGADQRQNRAVVNDVILVAREHLPVLDAQHLGRSGDLHLRAGKPHEALVESRGELVERDAAIALS